MKALSTLTLAALFALAAVLVACDEDSTGIEPPSGMNFSFSGDLSGIYEAAGTPAVDTAGRPEFGSWAIMALPDSLDGIVITSFRPTGDPRGDFFVLQLAALHTGEFTPCEPNADCHGRIFFGVNVDDFSDYDHYFEILSGSVTITEIRDDRLRGSFEFSASDEGGAGSQTITVSAGELDVPFGSTTENNAVWCMADGAATGTNGPC
ncbi:MAG: hypothetical protein AMS25_08250 [Gemmatimonas sp. SM23_52]|nr:MAG: hypothetical protein AMS25_08250 [Gemmatimonas sp. SM23_52]